MIPKLTGSPVLIFIVLFSCEVRVETKGPLDHSNIRIEDFDVAPSVGIRTEQTIRSPIRLFANGFVISKNEFPIKKGGYLLSIEAKGTPAYTVYPKIKVFLGDLLLDELQLGDQYSISTIKFKVEKEQYSILKLQFDSDGLDDKGNDRDVFIKSISLQVKQQEEEQSDLQNKDFNIPTDVAREENSAIRLFANGAVTSKNKIELKPGDYSLMLEAKGTPAYNVYPKIKIFLSDNLIEEVQLSKEYDTSFVGLHIKEKQEHILKLEFASDGLDDQGNDRDVFIKSISLKEGRIESSPIVYSDLALKHFDISEAIGRKTDDSVHLFANGSILSKSKVIFQTRPLFTGD